MSSLLRTTPATPRRDLSRRSAARPILTEHHLNPKGEMSMNLPKHIVKFLEENFPAEKDLAGYVICIANRDKTLTVVQGYDSMEVRDKVSKALAQHTATWEGSFTVGQAT
jgi:hypothetical protein